jgi:hypothetical protein
MRFSAKRFGKSMPTWEECEAGILETGMVCPVRSCKKKMLMQAQQGSRDIVSLQHWRNGSYGFICMGCNDREKYFPTDEMIHEITVDQKWCPNCEIVKSKSEFYPCRNAVHSQCKVCFRENYGG